MSPKSPLPLGSLWEFVYCLHEGTLLLVHGLHSVSFVNRLSLLLSNSLSEDGLVALVLLLVNVHVVHLVVPCALLSMGSGREVSLVFKLLTLLGCLVFVHLALGMLFQLVLEGDREVLLPHLEFVLERVARRYTRKEGIVVIRKLAQIFQFNLHFVHGLLLFLRVHGV